MTNAGKAILTALQHRIRRSGTVFEGRDVTINVNPTGSEGDPEGMSEALLWQYQPHVRTVIDFQAQNIAQLGLHAFDLKDDGDRERQRGTVLTETLRKPNPNMTDYDLIYDLVSNLALYNRAYWWIYPSPNSASGWEIQPLPAPWVTPKYEHQWKIKHYVIALPMDSNPSNTITIDPDQLLTFDGWAPEPGQSATPIDTLRLILEEQHPSRRHKLQVWKRNGRVGSYITRPKDAPGWTNRDRARFMEMYEAFAGDHGARAGGTPILEDGMALNRVGFSAHDEQWAESVTLSLKTCAQVYQINPTMVGVLESTNYSNVREFNRQLYSGMLGSTVRRIERRINSFGLEKLDVDDSKTLVEFNIAEKLRGSFEEQNAVAQTAVGAPYMTINEFRKMQNLPAVPGGDELVKPLNLTQNGDHDPVPAEDPDAEDEPTDGPPEGEEEQTPSEDQPAEDPKVSGVLETYLERLSRVVPSKGFNRERFDRELAQDLALAECNTALAKSINDALEGLYDQGLPTPDAAQIAKEIHP